MVNLEIELAGLKLNNPVMNASGTFGKEYAEYVKLDKLGAIVTKSISLQKKAGNPPPRIVETPAGMLNSIGLQNEGVEFFIKETLPLLEKFKVPVIANIAGESVEEYSKLAEIISEHPGIKALELNISCPNVDKGGMQFGCSPELTGEVVKAVRQKTRLPLIAKLSPNVTDITLIARQAEKAGADALSLINTLLGMSIDVNSWKPRLGNTVGGLSGPAIRPVAVRMVWQVCRAVKIPVIGIGGIMDAEDAVEFFLAGASAVQIGTASFTKPDAAIRIIDGLKEYLGSKKIPSIKDLIGKVKAGGNP